MEEKEIQPKSCFLSKRAWIISAVSIGILFVFMVLGVALPFFSPGSSMQGITNISGIDAFAAALFSPAIPPAGISNPTIDFVGYESFIGNVRSAGGSYLLLFVLAGATVLYFLTGFGTHNKKRSIWLAVLSSATAVVALVIMIFGILAVGNIPEFEGGAGAGTSIFPIVMFVFMLLVAAANILLMVLYKPSHERAKPSVEGFSKVAIPVASASFGLILMAVFFISVFSFII